MSVVSRRSLLATGFGFATGGAAIASAETVGPQKPKLAAGRHPGGLPVAILGAGVDYTLPAIAIRLARDGEGEAIAWDVIDDDARPYERMGPQPRPAPADAGTPLAASLLTEAPGVCLIPVRVPADDPLGLMGGLAFAARTPARIAVLLVGETTREPWQPFADVARHASHLLLIAPAGHAGKNIDNAPPAPARLDLGNLITATAVTVTGDRMAGVTYGPRIVDVGVPVGLAGGLGRAATASALENAAAIRLAVLAARLIGGIPSQPDSGVLLKARLLAMALQPPEAAARTTRHGAIPESAFFTGKL